MKLWRKCKHCGYSNHIIFKDEEIFEFICKRCGKKTKTAKLLSKLNIEVIEKERADLQNKKYIY